MNYFSLFKTIFIVCFGVILFIVSHSSISSPITDYKLSIGNIFEVVPNGEDTWDLKLMDEVDRDPIVDWGIYAKRMIKFMNRLPERKIQIISLGKYHSDLFLIIGKDTSADNEWGQMVLRLNTGVDDRYERKIFGTCFMNAFQKATEADKIPDIRLENDRLIHDIRLENDRLLAAIIMSDWMNYDIERIELDRKGIEESEVDKVNERKIVAPFFKKAFQKVTGTKYFPSQRTVEYEMSHGYMDCSDPFLALANGRAPELARDIMRQWLQYNVECGKEIAWEYSGNPILPLDSELISDLTAEDIDDCIKIQGIKEVVFDITLLDRLSSFVIIQVLPKYFLDDSKEENLFECYKDCIWPLLYLTPDGSLIPKTAEAEYNVEISDGLVKVRTNDDIYYKHTSNLKNNTVADHLSNPLVHGYYRLTQMTNDNVHDLFETQKGCSRPKISYTQEHLPTIKKLKKLINDIDMTKKEGDILERSQELAHKQISKRHRWASRRARPYNHDLFETQKGCSRPKISYTQEHLPTIKKLKKLINYIDMMKKEGDILECSQELACKQTSKEIARPYNQRMSSCVEK